MSRPIAAWNFLANPIRFAGALVRNSVRRPAVWLTASGAGAALIGAGLLLPSPGGADRARLVASFTMGMIFLLLCLAGALLPPVLHAGKRQEEILEGWAALPGGAAGAFMGTFLASILLMAGWAAMLLLLGALALFAVHPSGDSSLAPREEIPPLQAGKTTLTPGDRKQFTFPPLPSHGTPSPVTGILEARLYLARPDAEIFGSPMEILLVGSHGSQPLHLASTSSLRTGRIEFRIPGAEARKGCTLEIRFGDGPFNAAIPAGGLRLFGERGSLGSNFLLAGLSAFMAALLVAAVSAAGSSFLSLPVALIFAAWIFLAGATSGPAAEALAAWEKMGLMRAKEGVPDLPAWFGVFRTFLESLLGVLPDLGTMNRATDVAQGRWITGHSLLRMTGTLALYLIPALALGHVVASRREAGGPEE
ncbi:MAG: hypothetical protein ACYTHM_14815 [Planctomycetota bacterium]|jgi:hypothetical protein